MQLICEGHSQITNVSQGFKVVLNRPSVLDQPVLQGDSDADAMGASIYGSAIYDGGTFRMWYQAWPKDWNQEDVISVGCVESDDGINWRRPNYGLMECCGSKANHLTDLPFHSPSVLIDPDANASKRYRAFGYTHPKKAEGRFSQKVNTLGFFTAYSSDGLHWELDSPDPTWPSADVITSAWDPFSRSIRIALKRNRYVGGMNRRAFDTAEWRAGEATQPVSALVPDDYNDIVARARGFNSGDYYGVGLMPTDGPTIGFLWNFRHQLPLAHTWGDRGRVGISIVYQLERGGSWQHVSGRPDWLSAENAPEWAQGAIYTAAYPIEVGDETWLYFCGTEDRHGWCGDGVEYSEWCKTLLQKKGFSKIGLAKWARDRIVGYESDYIEHISLTPRKSTASRLALNAVTSPGGLIRAQLVSEDDKKPIPGYSYDDCEPISGDHLEVAVGWKGKNTLPSLPVNAEVEITRGTLYAFDFTVEAVG